MLRGTDLLWQKFEIVLREIMRGNSVDAAEPFHQVKKVHNLKTKLIALRLVNLTKKHIIFVPRVKLNFSPNQSAHHKSMATQLEGFSMSR